MSTFANLYYSFECVHAPSPLSLSQSTLLPLPPADPPNLPLVCCLLCVVQKRISLSLAGAIRNELTRTHTLTHTRASLTHTHTAGTHIQPSPVHTSQRHTHTHAHIHWGRQADATRRRWLRQRRSRSSQQQQQRQPRRFWLVDDVGNRKSELSARSAAETHTAKNEGGAKVLHVQCVG